jgi:uridine kinase
MKNYQIEPMQAAEGLAELVAEGDRSLESRMRCVSRNIATNSDQRLIGLTGPTCSGKTTAARLFTDYMETHGHTVHVISVDDFYYDKEYLTRRAEADPNIEIDYDSEDTIDVELLAARTESLLACRPTRMPRFDFQTGERVDGGIITPRAGDLFLFEGIQILFKV